jgi:conjugal transfer mating pair stabilization protein TraN
MKILIKLIFLIAVTIYFQAKGGDVAIGFNKRDTYANKTQLGNPDSAAKFIDPKGDVSHLGSLNDSSLTGRGTEELRSSPMGKILQNAEEKKIDAIERYKINSSNVMIKNSLAIEENPMAKTGGKGLSATEQVSSVKVEKTCTEGVDFNVDVGLELVLEVEEEGYLDSPVLKSIDIPYAETPGHWWQRQEYSEGNLSLRSASGSGFSFQYDTIINSPEVLGQIQAAIAKRIEVDGIVTIPSQDIVLNTWGGFRNEKMPTKNVIFPPGTSKGSGSSLGYKISSSIIKFHYNLQGELKRLIEKDEYWQVATEGMEQLAETNECYETGRVCLKSGVKTFLEKYDVVRPCWYEKISYRCTSEPKDGCAHLIKQDCQLKDSVCEYQVGSICLRWKRDYVCGGIKKELFYSLADSPIYCLGGDCHTPVLEENRDFANVAYLAALNEANKDCVKAGGTGLCKDPITVFPGHVSGCEKAVVGFVDCCSSMKGWGKNAHLCKCSGEEQGLALKRDKGLCHEVGMYCSKKDPVLGQCLMKKRNFCCFSSKLARIFHEQGRKQLGIDWGAPSSPNCRPFTLDELKSLDFSKFDMEELFDALLSKGKSNANKSFPVLSPGEIPEIQQEHMATSTEEKREIRRRAAEEEARKIEAERLAKLEAERLERERIERERLVTIARLEKERLASLERERLASIERERKRVVDQKRVAKQQEINATQIEYDRASAEYDRFSRLLENEKNPLVQNDLSRQARGWYIPLLAAHHKLIKLKQELEQLK